MSIYSRFKDHNGIIIDPFSIALFYDMPAPIFECMKKLLCAGIKGRTKSKLQDLTEALDTLRLCHKLRAASGILKGCTVNPEITMYLSEKIISKVYELKLHQCRAFECFMSWYIGSYSNESWYQLAEINLIRAIEDVENGEVIV